MAENVNIYVTSIQKFYIYKLKRLVPIIMDLKTTKIRRVPPFIQN